VDSEIIALQRAVVENPGDKIAQRRLSIALARIPNTPPAAETDKAARRRAEFRDIVNGLAARANGRARERRIGGAGVAALVRLIAAKPVGSVETDTGGAVSKSYLRGNSADTTCILVERVRGAVRVRMTREKISRFDPNKTYDVMRSAETTIPLFLVRTSQRKEDA
jgi:hypothetical protein